MIGIICEFDPFHHGHQHLIDEARKRRPESGILCVMSPDFVQRGGPTLYDKWTRTRMALLGGADIVIELPTYYATATAERFAAGGVRLLMASGVVDTLAFGIEDPTHLPLLRKAAVLLSDPSSAYQDLLRQKLRENLPFAVARSQALSELLGAPLPSLPNEILALEYMSAMERLGWHPELLPVERTVPHGPSDVVEGAYLSASTIRSKAEEGQDITQDLPYPLPCSPVFYESLYPLLRYRLCFHDQETLSGIDEVGEGLENRILSVVSEAGSYKQMVDAVRSKRYPEARIRRILLNIVLDISKEKKTRLMFESGPGYLRVLGVREGSLSSLGELARMSALPVVTQPPRQMGELAEPARQMLQDEMRFSRIYRCLVKEPSWPLNELTIPMVIQS